MAHPWGELDKAECKGNLGLLYFNNGQFKEGQKSLEDALRVFRSIPGTEPLQAKSLTNLGIYYLQNNKLDEAWRSTKEALTICERFPVGTEQIRNSCLEILRQLR